MTIKAFVFDAYGTLFDVHSVYQVTEDEYPSNGELITQVWRLKQLEYTWLRSLMGEYRTFWQVSEESLRYTLKSLGLAYEKAKFERIMDKYIHLNPYPDCKEALDALKIQDVSLAILSNGNQEMLDSLVENTGLNSRLDEIISVDDVKIFKPHSKAYELVEKRMKVARDEVIFVSSNSFDACAAKNFGFKVAWIERVTPEAMSSEIAEADNVNPTIMFKALRMQKEEFDMDPDFKLTTLSDLTQLLSN